MITRFGAVGEPPVALTTADYAPGSATDLRSEGGHLYAYMIEGSIEVELARRPSFDAFGDAVVKPSLTEEPCVDAQAAGDSQISSWMPSGSRR